MNCRILTIGDELLQGYTVDRNSSWLSKELYLCGIDTKYISSIGDDYKTIKNELRSIIDSNFDYVFITGGLGPTHDDITVNAFSEFFKLDKNIDEIYLSQLKKKFEDKGLKMPKVNEVQAIVLDKCIAINNPIGTARCIHYKHGNIKFFILPGVPSEMRAIFNQEIKPNHLSINSDDRIKIIKTSGKSESFFVDTLGHYLHDSDYKIGFLPYFTGVNIKIEKINYDIPVNQFTKYCNKIYDKLIPFSYGWDSDTIEALIVNSLIDNNKTIAVSESCTGGLLSKKITDISGSSKIFLGGLVAYSNTIKSSVLNVNPQSINTYGAVHHIIAKEMAHNIRLLYNSDIGVGITGISGPTGGSNEKPIGLVYICISYANQFYEKDFVFPFGRDIHRQMTVQTVFNMLRKIDMKHN